MTSRGKCYNDGEVGSRSNYTHGLLGSDKQYRTLKTLHDEPFVPHSSTRIPFVILPGVPASEPCSQKLTSRDNAPVRASTQRTINSVVYHKQQRGPGVTYPSGLLPLSSAREAHRVPTSGTENISQEITARDSRHRTHRYGLVFSCVPDNGDHARLR